MTGRPLSKMNDNKLKILIEKYPTTTLLSLAREFDMDHTTVLYWVKKLRAQGVKMEKDKVFIESESSKLIKKVVGNHQMKIIKDEQYCLKKINKGKIYTLSCQNRNDLDQECGHKFKAKLSFVDVDCVKIVKCPKCNKPFRGED